MTGMASGRGAVRGGFAIFMGGYYYATPWWTTEEIIVDRGMSCREGARIVSRRGFNRVTPLDCSGEFYTYRGWRGGDPWRIRVELDTARIISTRPAG